MGADTHTTQDEFEAQFEALRRHYLEGLPVRRVALAAAWNDCRDGSAEDAWQRLRDVAHKLSGSASNFGLEAIGAAAREVDRLLSARQPCRERARVQPAVDGLLARLDGAGDDR